jgi:hypothetical protein
MDALAVILAANANKGYAQSALPHAPIEPPQLPRPSRTGPLRWATAAALHRLADVVEPHVAAAGHPATH